MKPLLTLALIALMPLMGQAQQKRALFLHGFNGGGDSWMSTSTPQDWVARGVIHGYVNYTFSMDSLATEALLDSLHSDIAKAMNNHFADQWVIVGHSLGGLLARTVYAFIKARPNYAHLNIVGVLTIGTPHQGARATAVAAPEIGNDDPSCPAITTVPFGYVNVQQVFNEFRFNVNNPLSYIHPVVQEVVLSDSTSLSTVQNAPKILSSTFCELKVWEQLSIDTQARLKIGVNGSIIQFINSASIPQPGNVRSLIGTEKAYIPVRAAADALQVNDGNELGILNNYMNIRSFYKANEDMYELEALAAEAYCWLLYGPFCSFFQPNVSTEQWQNHERWKRGRQSLQNIDFAWARIIDEVESTSTTVWTWQPIGSCGAPEINPENPPKATHADQTTECIDGVEYGYVPVTTTVYIPKKNDVLLGPAYAVWSPGQSPNNQSVNFLYDDLPTDGGYNHFELRRSKRAYSLPGVFNAGDRTPPMIETEQWLNITVFVQP